MMDIKEEFSRFLDTQPLSRYISNIKYCKRENDNVICAIITIDDKLMDDFFVWYADLKRKGNEVPNSE